MWIWLRDEWPSYKWDDSRLLSPIATARLKQGRFLGRMQALGFDHQRAAQLKALTEDVLKTSEIEGEVLDHDSVRSSLARRLGMPEAAIAPSDRRTDGVVDMTLDATQRIDAPLTAERLFGWQAALFPTGWSGLARIKVGRWRDDAGGPMQVVSGHAGRERVHYEAPPADRVPAEMDAFLRWFAAPPAIDGLIRAGIAHLWFVTIHPFDDGNGRVARAIADQALAQSEGSSQRFYSMSSQIRRERAQYYAVLEHTQRGSLDVTDWLAWFLGCFSRTIDGAEGIAAEVLRKAEFWRRHDGVRLNERQRAILNRFLDGFQGKLTARKWAILGRCSPASAQRDINDLVEKGMLQRNLGGSKNTSYALTP